MAITLGPNQYGKAEVRLVTVERDGPTHHLRDLTVSTSLRGELERTHLTEDAVLCSAWINGLVERHGLHLPVAPSRCCGIGLVGLEVLLFGGLLDEREGL